MANEEHLRILQQGVVDWNQWRENHPNEIVDLTDADLTDADLIAAHLTRADLTRAHLTDADLFGADLGDADLSDADLSGADLTDADLSGADLTRVDLTRANLCRTVFGDTDLTDAKGLDSCTHSLFSILDHRTLTKSGRLPLSFLRGCGLPEILIDHIPALFLDNPIEFYSCFISYSTADSDFAERLYADLQNKGVRCWFAPEEIKTGEFVLATIDTAIRLRDKLVIILSETSIASDWVEHEVSRALREEKRRGTLVLFPLRIDETIMQVEFGWAKRIREAHTPTGRHIGNFTQWKDHDAYQQSFARLLRDLRVEDATNPS